MFKGFYNLTSGMLSQGRRLDVVANNMTNLSTAGYKTEHYADSTFDEFMLSRIGNKDKTSPEELGALSSYILAPSKLHTDYTQGAFEETGMPLDFALEGEGFFAVQMDGGNAYTRSGSFSLDEAGYLCMQGMGRVLDTQGQQIYLGTDKLNVREDGSIHTEEGDYLGTLGIFVFEDNEQLQRNDFSLYTGGGQPTLATDTKVHSKMLERSNVELADQMVKMISTQRALQSAAQLSKIYDALMSKAVNDVGRL